MSLLSVLRVHTLSYCGNVCSVCEGAAGVESWVEKVGLWWPSCALTRFLSVLFSSAFPFLAFSGPAPSSCLRMACFRAGAAACAASTFWQDRYPVDDLKLDGYSIWPRKTTHARPPAQRVAVPDKHAYA